MSARKRLAAWLDPDTAKDARRHLFLRVRLSEASDWLGVDFPVVHAVIRWAMVSEAVHFATAEDDSPAHVPSKPWIYHISDLRDHLRGAYLSSETAPSQPSATDASDERPPHA